MTPTHCTAHCDPSNGTSRAAFYALLLAPVACANKRINGFSVNKHRSESKRHKFLIEIIPPGIIGLQTKRPVFRSKGQQCTILLQIESVFTEIPQIIASKSYITQHLNGIWRSFPEIAFLQRIQSKLYPVDRTAREFKIHSIGHKEINKPLVTDTRVFWDPWYRTVIVPKRRETLWLSAFLW